MINTWNPIFRASPFPNVSTFEGTLEEECEEETVETLGSSPSPIPLMFITRRPFSHALVLFNNKQTVVIFTT
eukprot:m.108808 g.108808  ORF g.108808 m.108808 type:complete len:72 (+) comp9196_c0_seq2:8793-9008(+)